MTITLTATEAKEIYEFFQHQYVSSTTQPAVYALIQKLKEDVPVDRTPQAYQWRVP
jgi:hypothetical protein